MDIWTDKEIKEAQRRGWTALRDYYLVCPCGFQDCRSISYKERENMRANPPACPHCNQTKLAINMAKD